MHARQLINSAQGVVTLGAVELADPGPGEILVKARASAVSPGTERAACLGLPGTARRWPVALGYSSVGEVVGAGPGVEIAPGTRVLMGTSHASAVVVAADRVAPAPEGVDDETAAFHRVLRIALQGVRKARIELGEAVLVLGGGLIGQLAAQFAHAAGAGRVLLADLAGPRRDLAARAGFSEPVDPMSEADRETIAAAGPAGGPQVVIEATGVPDVTAEALRFAGPLGRVVLLGSSRGLAREVDFYRDVHVKGLTILGAHNSVRAQAAKRGADIDAMMRWPHGVEDFPGIWTSRSDNAAAFGLLQSGRIDLDALITHRADADDFDEIYDPLLANDPHILGAVIRWPA